MNRERKKTDRWQRGSGLVEFCFTMPILLLIAGATIDLSRYMRFLQITTFVSQETAGQIYRQCSDITIYDPPELGVSGLRPNKELTTKAIAACVQNIQAGAQDLLNTSLGRAAVSSTVFRWNIDDASLTSNCSTATAGQVTTISANANLDVKECKNRSGENEGEDDEEGEDDSSKDTTTGVTNPDQDSPSSSRNCSPLYIPSRANKNNGVLPPGLTDKGITLRDNGIYQTKNGTSGQERKLATLNTLCQRGRIATVEVSYAFEPVVKFLPHIMVKLDENGSQRETTVL